MRDMDGNPLPEGGMGKPDPDMLKAMGLDPNEPMPEKKDDGQLPPTTPVYEYSATAVYPKDQPRMPEKYTQIVAGSRFGATLFPFEQLLSCLVRASILA